MKRRTAALAALAAGAIVGSAGAATFALWNNDVSSSATVKVGYIDFAVSSPNATPKTSIAAEGDQLSLELRALGDKNPFAALAVDAPQYVPIQVDGQSQGNRGLSYAMTGVTPSGADRTLVDATSVQIREITELSDCAASAFTGNAPTVYSGPLTAARISSRQLVSSAYSTATYDHPESDFYCLKLTAPGTSGSYTNKATVNGVPQTTLVPSAAPTATAEDSWTTKLGYSDAARAATVSFVFDHDTFRGNFQ